MPADSVAASQRFFAPRAAAYRASASHGNAAELARMLSLVGALVAARVLDVATGGGQTARAWAEAGGRVVATDATRAMLAGVAWPAVVCDAHALPFGAGRFDVVACRIAAHHFADLPLFVREAARVLSPGGKLYVFDLTTPPDKARAGEIDGIERLRDPSHGHSHSAEEWRAALGASGLSIVHLETPRSMLDAEPWIARAGLDAATEKELRLRLAAASEEGGYGLQRNGKLALLRVELVARRDG